MISTEENIDKNMSFDTWTVGTFSKKIELETDKTFGAKAVIELSLTVNYDSVFGLNPSAIKLTFDNGSNKDLKEHVEGFIDDPTYQASILNKITFDSVPIKKLEGTWKESKDEVLEKIPLLVMKQFGDIAIEIFTYYLVNVNGDNIKTHSTAIGYFSIDTLSHLSSFSNIFDIACEKYRKHVEEIFASHIEEENNRVENDIQLLKILIKKYPDVDIQKLK